MKLVLKGFLMGIANVIPGVSGGTIAIILGIYEQLISAINSLFKNFKKNMKFLIPVGIGMVLSILSMSKVIDYSYKNFPIPTFMFFMGLVIGGIPLIRKNIKNKEEQRKPINYVIGLLTFSLVIFLASYKLIFDSTSSVQLVNLSLYNYIILFLVGMIASATMVIPGISGSLVLMILGYYYPIIETINKILSFDNLLNTFLILGVFGFGVLFGFILVAKLLEILFAKFRIKTYFGILGFIYASIIAIPISAYVENPVLSFNLVHFIVGIVTLLLGTVVSYKLGEK